MGPGAPALGPLLWAISAEAKTAGWGWHWRVHVSWCLCPPISHAPLGLTIHKANYGTRFRHRVGATTQIDSIKRWYKSTGACTPAAQWNSSGKSFAHASIVFASVSRFAGSDEAMTSLTA